MPAKLPEQKVTGTKNIFVTRDTDTKDEFISTYVNGKEYKYPVDTIQMGVPENVANQLIATNHAKDVTTSGPVPVPKKPGKVE
jgi:hypothetical protein